MRGFAVVCSFAVIAPAHADEFDRSHEVRLDVGVGSALGFAGASYTYARSGYGVEAGAGLGVTGVQLSVMPKIYVGSGRTRFVVGAGLSVALVSIAGNPANSLDHTGGQSTYWLNLDVVGVEHRWRNGLTFSSSLGATIGVGGTARWCLDLFDSPSCGEGLNPYQSFAGKAYPQLRLGIGYWF